MKVRGGRAGDELRKGKGKERGKVGRGGGKGVTTKAPRRAKK